MLVAGRFTEDLLFGVKATDPATLGSACVVLVVTAALACAVPARRVMQLDPVETLRKE